jgi:hypothetical protein
MWPSGAPCPPRSLIWTKIAEQIVNKVQRGRVTLDAITN